MATINQHSWTNMTASTYIMRKQEWCVYCGTIRITPPNPIPVVTYHKPITTGASVTLAVPDCIDRKAG
jgi:hypothetical protein